MTFDFCFLYFWSLSVYSFVCNSKWFSKVALGRNDWFSARFQVTTMMMDAEKDGKPLPMVNGKVGPNAVSIGFCQLFHDVATIAWPVVSRHQACWSCRLFLTFSGFGCRVLNHHHLTLVHRCSLTTPKTSSKSQHSWLWVVSVDLRNQSCQGLWKWFLFRVSSI